METVQQPRCFVYGLVDPRTKLVFYVGESSVGMQRPKRHATELSDSDKSSVIRELQSLGQNYAIVILEVVDVQRAPHPNPCWTNAARNPTWLHEAERWWISLGRAFGWPLTNITEGGQGTRGRKYVVSEKTKALLREKNPMRNPEIRARMAATKRAQAELLTADDRRRISERLHRGLGPEARAKAAAKNRGRKMGEEQRARMRAGAAGRRMSEAGREKIRFARTGKKYGPRSDAARTRIALAVTEWHQRRADERRELIDADRQRVLAALDDTGGNQSRAALKLGIPPGTLISKLERYGLKAMRPSKR